MPASSRSRRARRCAFLVSSLATLAACSPDPAPTEPAAAGSMPTAVAAGRPNILVIMTDDQTFEEMRVMPKTRALIGAVGTTFTRNVVTYALCCPSRSTFLTGQYPHNHGVRSNGLPDGGVTRLDHGNTLPLWLQETGYVTGHIGKYLNGYGEVDSLWVPPGYTEWFGSVGHTAYRYYEYVVNENGTLVRYGTTPEQYQSDVYTEKALDFIRRRGPEAAAGGPPFFLFVTYLAPHWGDPVEPGDPALQTPVPAPRHRGRYASQQLPATPSFNEANMADKPLSMRRRALLTLTQAADLHEAYRQRLESLLAVDQGVGRMIVALQTAGVLQNTLVIFTSDNGWFQGEHRIGFGKVLPYEPAVRVPLLVRGPGVMAGRRVSAAVANIDLAPTIVAAAGAAARRTMDGQSLWPLLQGQNTWASPNGARHLLVEDSPSGGSAGLFWSIRRGTRYVYTEYANGDREFYDLVTDSAQIASQHANASYATIRQQLAKRLAAMKTCTGPSACW